MARARREGPGAGATSGINAGASEGIRFAADPTPSIALQLSRIFFTSARGPLDQACSISTFRGGGKNVRFPLHVTTDIVGHQIRNALAGQKRYPFVLMLEPLYTCNLACIGCSIERHTGKLADRLPVETCLKAVDDCGAPAVSICGGEPSLYPELPQLIDGIIARKRHIYLCTNGLLLDDKVFGKIAPRKRLTLNVHLDGMRATHDAVCAREGVFDKVIELIKQAKELGYHVTTNTTSSRRRRSRRSKSCASW